MRRREQLFFIISVGEHRGLARVHAAKRGDHRRVRIRLYGVLVIVKIQRRTDRVIRAASHFRALDTKLGPVVNGRDARKGEEKRVHRNHVLLVLKLRIDSLDVMVVHEVVQPAALRTAVTVHKTADCVRDLKEIVRIAARIQGLVELIIRHGVKVCLVDPPRIIPVNDLAHQPEIGLYLICRAAKRRHEIKVEHVSRVETEAVHIKFRHPEADDVADILLHLRISLIQLDEQVVAAPVVIGKAVVVLVIAPEIHVAEPVLVAALLAVLLQILKCEEIAADVVEHAIENDMHALVVAGLHKALQVFICPETRIELLVVGRVIAVRAGLKERSDIKGVAADFLHMVDPRKNLVQAVAHSFVVICLRRPGQSERINVIKYSFIIPGHYAYLFSVCCQTACTSESDAIFSLLSGLIADETVLCHLFVIVTSVLYSLLVFTDFVQFQCES